MKVNKLFSIDYELAAFLSRENNASAVVNMLLRQFYEDKAEDLEKKNTGNAQTIINDTEEDENSKGKTTKTT